MLVLLASLSPSYESLVIAFPVGKSTIKIDEVTTVIFQNEILRRKNPASSSGGGSSGLVVSEGKESVSPQKAQVVSKNFSIHLYD